MSLTEMKLFLSRQAMEFYSIMTTILSGEYHDTDLKFFPHWTERQQAES